MKKKNRFGALLEELMTIVDIKNYVLARELGYDVSYISKWISGAMLPSDKNSEMVLKGISKCIVNSLNDISRQKLYSDYYLGSDEELEEALYDNLYAEYVYVKGDQKKGQSTADQKVDYLSQCSIKDFISVMNHPVLRKVKHLDVMAMIDILNIEKEHRLKIAFLENYGEGMRGYYPEVHFSLVFDLKSSMKDSVYNAIFLLNMYTNFMNVDFKAYVSKKAYGKTVFAVKDAYSASAMLVNAKTCRNVVTSEDQEIAGEWYAEVAHLCNRETLAIRRGSVTELVKNKEYMYSLIAKDAKWMIGHFTESLLPHDLFEEVLQTVSKKSSWALDNSELRKTHKGVAKMLPELDFSVLFTDDSFKNFLVTGKLDFYNHWVYLSVQQRVRCLRYIVELIENGKLNVKLSTRRLVEDFSYTTNPCIYLSDYISYVRVDKEMEDTVLVMNRPEVVELFKSFYYEIWNEKEDIMISDRQAIVRKIKSIITSAELLEKIEAASN